jgi:D-psicose/D-tagatose/L-ribulose 3-epimerase
MKIGVNTLIWTGGFDREHLPLVAEVRQRGFDAIEVARFNWQGFPAAELRKEAQKEGVEVLFCSAFTTPDCCLTSMDSVSRAAAAAYMQQAVDAAAESGSSMLAGPFHSPVGALVGRRRNADEWKYLADGLRDAGDYAGRHGVRIAVEPLNRFESYVLNTAADAARLCDEVNHPAVGVLYDTFHGNIEEKDQGNAIRSVGRHLFHMHTCENDRGTPGSGHVEWDKVAEALRAVNYSGYLVIESFGFAIKELAAAACIWRDLAASPDSIAWDGVRFLRKLT